ncbi:11285_t:CDS:10 [Funneliformis geosporum]|uniref:11285_t:CDS:1 n=1 Tax=Funneliformis geosporum TaxID=1117311 RepID=A0A9W4SNA4_9GLOM|nr:11285_t:CDS:10 [Funneliformis geosporum]
MGLAEPRIKQRISADPRNLAWSNDQNKFGYKMLSKMGWLPGKGLGVNEDGAKEHIKLSLKQDNLGIGATKKTIDNWLDNSSAFDSLLKGLNEKQGRNEIDGKGKDSEQDSSSSTNDSTTNTSDSGSLSSIRLAHRAKFLKSKKAAIQNSDRLNEIFGIKSNKANFDDLNNLSIAPSSLKGNKVITTITTIASSSETDESDQNNNTVKSIRKGDIVTNVNEMSTHEYFAQKMKGLKLSGIANTGLSGCNKMNAESDERPSFSMGVCSSFVSSEQDSIMSNNPLNGLGLADNSNKKRKRDCDIDVVNSKKSIKKDEKSKKQTMKENTTAQKMLSRWDTAIARIHKEHILPSTLHLPKIAIVKEKFAFCSTRLFNDLIIKVTKHKEGVVVKCNPQYAENDERNESSQKQNDEPKQRILVCVGVPGSGKSTFSKELCKVDNNWFRVNQDDLGSRRACESVSKLQINKRKNVIVDRCNFDKRQRKTWVDLAIQFNLTIDAIIMDTPYEICEKRILSRENHPTNVQGRKGLEILENFKQIYKSPDYNEGFERILIVKPHDINECNENDVKEVMEKLDNIPKRVVERRVKIQGRGGSRGENAYYRGGNRGGNPRGHGGNRGR